jgi:hypothetical protein
MSKARQLYKGTPSKLVKVLEEGTAFEQAIYVKPPSAKSRAVFYNNLQSMAEESEKVSEETAIEKLQGFAVDLILITNSDGAGKPVFTSEDKLFLSEEFDQGYFDKLVIAGAEIIKLPDTIKKGLLLDIEMNMEIEVAKEEGKKD